VTVVGAPWAGNQGSIPWEIELNVLLEDTLDTKTNLITSPSPNEILTTPWSSVTSETSGIAKVFRWVQFDLNYTKRFIPFHFKSNQKIKKGQVFAIITGHGNDNHGCGEFCATQHIFTLDGRTKMTKNQTLPISNAPTGCAEYIDSGVVPNEFGTWLYGRNGWCNGRNVELWQSKKFDLQEGSHVLSYNALWCSDKNTCQPPNPGPPSEWSQSAPVIMISVWIGLYE
jgi:hypothetical protein